MLASVALLAIGACSSDDDVAETGDAPDTTVAAGAVTPTVICHNPSRGVVYFGYTNDGAAPVEIPVGEANSITVDSNEGNEGTDQQPQVFAPGEQGAVVWAAFIDPAFPMTWSITSADGTARTASADGTGPECPDGVPPLDPPDDREPTFTAEVDTSGDTPLLTITLEGLPDESRCPSGTGWTPAPPEVAITAGAANATEVTGGADPATVQFEVTDAAAPPFPGFTVPGFVSVNLAADVNDHCTHEDGTTSDAWAAGPAFLDLSQIGTFVCFGAVDGGYDETPCSDGPQLAPTGGIRNR